MSTIVLGPLLGFASQDAAGQLHYQATIVLDQASVTSPILELSSLGRTVMANQVAVLPSGREVWTAEFGIAASSSDQKIPYRWTNNGVVLERTFDKDSVSAWSFLVPGSNAPPRIVFASCNGFSDPKLKRDQKEPFALWDKICKSDAQSHLLVLGGDQVYADGVLSETSGGPAGQEVNLWLASNHQRMLKAKWTPALEEQSRQRFENCYMLCWNQPAIARAMASIPSLMMWDDHDIMDGWGSFPVEWQNCEFMQGYYKVARWFFETLQIRASRNTFILKGKPNLTQLHRIGSTGFLLLDARSERTQDQFISANSWQAIHDRLAGEKKFDTLFVVAGVPMIYLDFRKLIPLQEQTGLKDDLMDHWRHPRHIQELTSLSFRLFDHVQNNRARQVVLLSGDVHVGGWAKMTHDNRSIHQVISSGIVHPPPGRFEWAGIRALSTLPDGALAGDKIQVRMCDPTRTWGQFVVERNYVSLQWGTDNSWWATWRTESKDPAPTARLDS